MAIKGIFWDNDGVLVDTESLYFQATAEILAGVDVELTRESFIEISLRRGESALDLARGKGLTEGALDQLRLERNDRYSALLRRGVKVIDGADEILKALQGQLKMAIVTSSRRDHFETIHHTTGLPGYFDFILTREDYTHSKPHPEPYLAALERSGLRADECLVVEDSERGLTAAVSAGLRCVVIPGELTGECDFSPAHRILGSVRELPTVLAG